MLQFTPKAWEQYISWQQLDRKKLQKINLLIRDILRSPFEGAGKPEPLKGDFRGFWSRRIDEEHRLVYSYERETLTIIACKYHYE